MLLYYKQLRSLEVNTGVMMFWQISKSAKTPWLKDRFRSLQVAQMGVPESNYIAASHLTSRMFEAYHDLCSLHEREAKVSSTKNNQTKLQLYLKQGRNICFPRRAEQLTCWSFLLCISHLNMILCDADEHHVKCIIKWLWLLSVRGSVVSAWNSQSLVRDLSEIEYDT